MSPCRAYLLLQDHAQRTGTYAEMISSDLHGAKIPPDGCCDPNQEQRDTKAYTEEKGEFSTIDTLAGLDLRGSFPPTMMLALEGP